MIEWLISLGPDNGAVVAFFALGACVLIVLLVTSSGTQVAQARSRARVAEAQARVAEANARRAILDFTPLPAPRADVEPVRLDKR